MLASVRVEIDRTSGGVERRAWRERSHLHRARDSTHARSEDQRELVHLRGHVHHHSHTTHRTRARRQSRRHSQSRTQQDSKLTGAARAAESHHGVRSARAHTHGRRAHVLVEFARTRRQTSARVSHDRMGQ